MAARLVLREVAGLLISDNEFSVSITARTYSYTFQNFLLFLVKHNSGSFLFWGRVWAINNALVNSRPANKCRKGVMSERGGERGSVLCESSKKKRRKRRR
jgi:hypothetical protein